MKPIHNIDYFLRFVTLPYALGGVTVLNDDGTYDVYINERICRDKQKNSFYHELAHIYLEHLVRDNISEKVKEQEAEHFAPYMEQIIKAIDPIMADQWLN